MSRRQMLLLTLTAALVLTSLALTSAAVQLGAYTYTSSPATGQASTFQFDVSNTGSSQVTATFLFIDLTGVITWSSPPLPTTLAPGEMQRLVTAFTLGQSATRTVQTHLVIRTAPADDTPAHQPVIMIFPHLPGPPLPSAPAPSAPTLTPAPLQLTLVSAPTLLTPGALSVKNTGAVHLASVEFLSPSSALTFSPNSIALAPSESRHIALSFSSPAGLPFGTSSAAIVARDGRNPASNVSLSFTFDKSFCSTGARGTNLTINDVKLRSTGKDDDEWKILDEVTIEVEVENRGTTDLEDVVVQLGLFDSQGRDQVNDLDFNNEDEEKIEINDLDDGDEDTVTFKFKVGGDIDDGNYKLTVKAFSKKTGEANLCTDSSDDLSNKIFETIKIEREDDEGKFIAFSNPKFSPPEATCGDTVTLTTEVVNIGDEDQDRVKVLLKSPELKLDLAEELRQGLDIGDDALVSFTFTVPQGLADKSYPLQLSAEYDFRSSVYRQRVQRPVLFAVKRCSPRVPSAPSEQRTITLTAPSAQPPQSPTAKVKPTQAPLQQREQPALPKEGFSFRSLLKDKNIIPLSLVILNLVLLVLIIAVAATRSSPSRSAQPSRHVSPSSNIPERKSATAEEKKKTRR